MMNISEREEALELELAEAYQEISYRNNEIRELTMEILYLESELYNSNNRGDE